MKKAVLKGKKAELQESSVRKDRFLPDAVIVIVQASSVDIIRRLRLVFPGFLRQDHI